MPYTLRQYMDGRLRWAMFEKGLQVEWNYLNQIINSEAGSGVTGGTTILGSVDITAATGLNKDSTAGGKGLSGTFAPGAEAGASAFQVPPSDHSGVVGPGPVRQSQRLPMAGFRPTT